ncbi:MAG: hypothetical protein ACR2KT_11590 [Methylocella sp.]|nr:MAG: hypothetical protein DLM68_19015 [Hyphomicrobiales bacterium]
MSYRASPACAGAFAAVASLAGICSIAPAFAHELRILPADHGKISLLVGFHVEPAFEDSFNAVDVILSTFDGACPAPNKSVSIGQPIDADGTMAAKDPDTVTLKVDALYLKKAVRPTGPHGSIAPTGIEATLTITDGSPLTEGFRNPGTYNSWSRPTHPGNATTGGAYGYHVYGKVHAGPNSFSCPGTKPRARSPREPRRSIPISFAVSQAASFRRTPSGAWRPSSLSRAMLATGTSRIRPSSLIDEA